MALNIPRPTKKTLLIALGVILSTLIAIKLLTPTPPPPPLPSLKSPSIPPAFPTQPFPSPEAIQFENVNLPLELPVYTLQTSALTQLEFNALATQLKLTPTAPQPDYLVAQNQTGVLPSSLVVDQKNQLLSYTQTLSSPINTTNLSAQILDMVHQFTASPIWENPRITTTFLSSSSPQSSVVAPPTRANTALLDLFPTIQGYRLVSATNRPIGKSGLATAWVNFADRTISLTLSLVAIDTPSPTTYPLKSLTALTQELNTHPPTPISIIPTGKSYKNLERGEAWQPKTTSYTKIETIYYHDGISSHPITPMFLLSGQATLTDGHLAEITALTPAIATK